MTELWQMPDDSESVGWLRGKMLAAGAKPVAAGALLVEDGIEAMVERAIDYEAALHADDADDDGWIWEEEDEWRERRRLSLTPMLRAACGEGT